jgi:23S rRNA (adenine2503-C2)-methyltransferase
MPRAGRKDITAVSGAEREAFLAAAGAPAYRARQLEAWLFGGAAATFEEMTNLPAALRAGLAEAFDLPAPRICEEARDDDGTAKYLFELADGAQVEAVYMPGDDHDAVCLSSQVGCPLRCRICATGTLPFRRHLTPYEIFAQFAVLQRRHAARRIRNAVFMGQGEPLANSASVAEAVRMLKEHFDLGGRRITVSTVGPPERIVRWAEEGPPTKLAVSLHSAIAKTRRLLMPEAGRDSLTELAAACAHYSRRTRRRLTFEYVVCRDVNDDRRHARALVAFTRALPCKINVLPFNSWPGAPYEAPTEEGLASFLAEVAEGPRALTLRRPRGAGIHAACGTLANRTGAPAAP